MTGTFNGAGNAALVFQAVTCDTAWQQFALFVDELEQKIGIFVINVLDTEFAETAIFFVPEPDFWVAEELYIFS